MSPVRRTRNEKKLALSERMGNGKKIKSTGKVPKKTERVPKETERNTKKKTEGKQKKTVRTLKKARTPKQTYKRWSGNGYDHGFEPDHIIGANEEDDVVIFFVEWKLSENGLLVGQNWIEAREIYEKHPQVAIQFFEEHLQFCCEE